MEDMKLKLSELEKQVSLIKDPNLRKVAFERLLDHSIGLVAKKKPLKKLGKTKSLGKKRKPTNLYYSDTKMRDPVKRMHVVGKLQGFPPFNKCKSKIDAYLWVLAYAKGKKIAGLNNHEIAFILTKKLYKQTKYSTVYGIRRKVKEGFVMLDPDSEEWIITPDGEEYLRTLGKND